jgi:hypothetical protein
MKKEKLIKNFSFSALVQGNVHCFSGLLRPGVRIFVKKMAVGGAVLIRRPRMRVNKGASRGACLANLAVADYAKV